MSNSAGAQTLTPINNENLNVQQTIAAEPVQKVAKSVVPQHTEPPTLEMLTAMYGAQNRECWLCDGIAKKIGVGKEISEDDSWHFTSCVLSWEYLHRRS